MTLDEIKKAQQIVKMLQNRMELGEEYVRVDDLNSAIEAVSDAIYKAKQQADLTNRVIDNVNGKIAKLSTNIESLATQKELEKLSTKLDSSVKKVASDLEKQLVDVREFVALFEKYDPSELIQNIELNSSELASIKSYIEDVGETSESIRNKLETLTGDERLSAKYISGLEDIISKLIAENQKLSGSVTSYQGRGGGNVEVFSSGTKVGSGQGIDFGSGFTVTHNGSSAQVSIASGSGVTVETPSGTVNGSNKTFTVTATPKWIVSDGIVYFENAGYTLSGLTVTMTSEPGQYIRAII